MALTNIFKNIPATLPDELFESLLELPGVRVERIVSLGHSSPSDFWYDQSQYEWVVLLSGAAVVQFENETPISLGPGDILDIAPHRRHRVVSTSSNTPAIWLAIHVDVKDA